MSSWVGFIKKTTASARLHTNTDRTHARTKCEKMLDQVTSQGRASKHKEECVGAFIIFNHVESARRCLDDYTTANNLIGSLLMPEELRFKISEERLKVDE